MASVLVVGGGVAGLTCAWRLARAGHDVEVIEREAVPGGRMRSERHGEFVLDRGAQFIASGYRNLHRVAETLDLAGRVRPVSHAQNAILRDGVLHAGDPGHGFRLLRSRLLSPRARARLPLLLLDLLRHRRRLEPLRPERAAAIDREDLASFARRRIGEEAFEYLLAPSFSATFDAEPEELSGAFGLLVLAFVARGFRLQSFEGGTGLLTQALAERVPVRVGWEVVSVETGADGARVRYRAASGDRTLHADGVVVALPGSEVPRVCGKLTPEESAFFAAVRYVRGIVAHLLLPEAPATIPGYGIAFPRREGIGLYGLAVDHRKPGVAPAGAGLVNAALRRADAERLWRQPDAAVAEHVLAALARTPVGRLEPREVVVHRWDPMLPAFHAGYTAYLARFLGRRERSPRLAFAGDYLVGPYIEAALTSGMRAATEIARELQSSR